MKDSKKIIELSDFKGSSIESYISTGFKDGRSVKEILNDKLEKGIIDQTLFNKAIEQYDNLIEKSGEGSRGGRIIGHTKSGKAIYLHENDSDSTSAGGIHGGKFKGWSKDDHMDAMKAHSQAKQEIHKKWHKEHAEHVERTGSGSGFKPANSTQEEKDRMNHMHNMDAHYYHYVVKHGGSRTDAYDATNTPYDASKKEEINKREIRK